MAKTAQYLVIFAVRIVKMASKNLRHVRRKWVAVSRTRPLNADYLRTPTIHLTAPMSRDAVYRVSEGSRSLWLQPLFNTSVGFLRPFTWIFPAFSHSVNHSRKSV